MANDTYTQPDTSSATLDTEWLKNNTHSIVNPNPWGGYPVYGSPSWGTLTPSDLTTVAVPSVFSQPEPESFDENGRVIVRAGPYISPILADMLNDV